MTIPEFVAANKGFSKLKEDQFHKDLYCARIISFYIYACAPYKKKKLNGPEELFHIPSDKHRKKKVMENIKSIERIEIPNGKQPDS